MVGRLRFGTWLLYILLTGYAHAQSVTIQGTLSKTDQDYRILLAEYDGSDIDTVIIKNGKFTFTRSLNHPSILLLAIETLDDEEVTGTMVFVEKGEVIVNLDVSKFYGDHTVVLTHPASQNLNKSFYKRFNPLKDLYNQYLRKSLDTKLPEAERKIYQDFTTSILKVEEKVSEEFVIENNNNLVGAFVFAKHLRHASASKQDSLYKLFDPALYNTKYLSDMRAWIDSRINVKNGNKAPDFKGIGPDNKNVQLSDFKGKYLILDFWGSWCGPCIAGFPKMKEYYAKYAGKIEILGIGCKDQYSAWLKAIEKHQLSWKHLFNDTKVDLTNKYGIKGFPTKVLIDAQGNIVEIFTGEGEDFYQALDKLFK